MKAKILLVLVVILSSCSSASYRHAYQSPKGLNLTEGTFIMLPVKSSARQQTRINMNELLHEKMNELAPGRALWLHEQTDLMIDHTERDIPTLVRQLNEQSNHDFLVVVSDQVMSNDMGSIAIGDNNGPGSAIQKNEASIILQVFDIRNQLEIFHLSVSGRASRGNDDNRDVVLTSGINKILFTCLKKGLKRIQDNAIY